MILEEDVNSLAIMCLSDYNRLLLSMFISQVQKTTAYRASISRYIWFSESVLVEFIDSNNNLAVLGILILRVSREIRISKHWVAWWNISF